MSDISCLTKWSNLRDVPVRLLLKSAILMPLSVGQRKWNKPSEETEKGVFLMEAKGGLRIDLPKVQGNSCEVIS